jgi:predicted DNA-binding transcriptional regulator AlpA
MTVEELEQNLVASAQVTNREQRRHPEKLLSVAELSIYLDVARQTIYGWNYYGTGPPVLHAGKYVRYRQSDVDSWLAK